MVDEVRPASDATIESQSQADLWPSGVHSSPCPPGGGAISLQVVRHTGDSVMRLVIIVGVAGFLIALAPGGLLAGEKSPAEKAVADWLYPGGTVVASGISSGKGGAVSCVVQEIADDVRLVLTPGPKS